MKRAEGRGIRKNLKNQEGSGRPSNWGNLGSRGSVEK